MFQGKAVEKIKTLLFWLNNVLPKFVPFVRQRGKILYSQTCHR